MGKIISILFVITLILSCKQKQLVKEDQVFYTCSMDPQVVASKPGKCPICGMQLTPVKKGTTTGTDDIELSDQQIHLGNILVDTIRNGQINNSLSFTGTLQLNASQTRSINARIMGRVEKLYVKSTGDYISKGAPLYELYSEELNNAKQEYIAALQRRHLFKDQTIIDFENLIQGSRNKLRLWGMTENQIRDLEKLKQAPLTTTFYSSDAGHVTTVDVVEGGYVMEGGTIIQLANLSTLWAEAQVYSSQVNKVTVGSKAVVQLPGGNEVKGKIEFSTPEIAPDSRVNIMRIQISNQGNRLKPGMPVVITVERSTRNSLTLPTDAIIQEARGATVWLQTGKNRFKSTMITTGIEMDGLTEITSGLNTGDVVVVRGAYLVHSEFVFKRGSDPMSGHAH